MIESRLATVLVKTLPQLAPRVHRLEELRVGAAAGALRGDEPQHVGSRDLLRRLGNHTEQGVQVLGSGEHPCSGDTAPCKNSRSSTTGIPSRTTNSPDGPRDRIKHGSNTDIPGPQLHKKTAATADRNVLEDHVHNKHLSAIRTGPRRPTGARSASCRVPVQHAQGPEGVPSAGPSNTAVQLDWHRAGMAGL
jgi:hypothetical protein